MGASKKMTPSSPSPSASLLLLTGGDRGDDCLLCHCHLLLQRISNIAHSFWLGFVFQGSR
jgi:hypothetical protein